METLRRRLAEQKARHQGGSKWIGTAGTSPFGAHGYNPEGVRIGQEEGKNRSAVKVWDRRDFRNLDDAIELGTRNIKLALRRLRQFAREGAAEELDLDGTVRSTAKNAGWLDLKLVPERHNAVKLLLFIDVGGSMEDHVRDLRGTVFGRPLRVQASDTSISTTAFTRRCGATRAAAMSSSWRYGADSHLRSGLQARSWSAMPA